jgi:hypothetical protein
MRKHKPPRITVNRETLHKLEKDLLPEAAAGALTLICTFHCNSNIRTCSCLSTCC